MNLKRTLRMLSAQYVSFLAVRMAAIILVAVATDTIAVVLMPFVACFVLKAKRGCTALFPANGNYTTTEVAPLV